MMSMFSETFRSSLNALEAIEASKKVAEVELPASHYERKQIYQALLEETSKNIHPHGSANGSCVKEQRSSLRIRL